MKAQERRNVSTSQPKESNVDEQSNSSSQQGTRQVPAPLPEDNVPRNIPQTAPAPVRDVSALIDGMIRDIILSRNNEEPRDGANLPRPPTAQLRPQPNQGHQRNAIAANLRDAATAAVDDNNDDPTDNNDDEPPVLRPLPNSPQRDNPNNNDGVPADIRPLQRPANQPAPRPRPQQRQVDRRDAIAADLSDDDEPQPQRRRLSDLIRENHELYNRFMTRTLPRILEHYGIDLDD